MSVPFNDLSRRYTQNKEAVDAAALRALGSGWYILGKEAEAFEKQLAQMFGAAGAVGVNSGTDAITIALRALGVGSGDEVITVGNTCTPTIAAIRLTGATPVFADVDPVTKTLDPNAIASRITPSTKAIVPVHLYGMPADMPAIMKVAKEHNLLVVEDCAQSIGATIAGKWAGTFGDAACLSFYPTKNLGAFGDGGAIVSTSEEVLARARRIRMYGEAGRYNSVEEGMNSRLDEVQAALLSWGLPLLAGWTERRKAIAERYRAGITNAKLTLPDQSVGGREGVWHLFVVHTDDREKFMSHMSAAGVGTAIHYPTPVYAQPAYAFLNESGAALPNTTAAMDRIVSLPIFPELTDAEVEEVIAAANAY